MSNTELLILVNVVGISIAIVVLVGTFWYARICRREFAQLAALYQKGTPEHKDAVSVVRNRRTDAMFACAYIAVVALVYLVVFAEKISEYGQGVITLVLGSFIGYLTAMYGFETMTTRGTQAKDDMIKGLAQDRVNESVAALARSATVVEDIAKTVPIAAAKAVEAANGAQPKHDPAPLKTENVSVEAAGNVTVARKEDMP